MREISYQRHEHTFPDPEDRRASLLTLVYDIPHFGACRVFPPLHVANEIFASGGSQGGMSPGATWEPLTIDADEYQELVQAVSATDPRSLGDAARYTDLAFIFDPSFDHLLDQWEWVRAVSAKHRADYHRRMGRSSPESP